MNLGSSEPFLTLVPALCHLHSFCADSSLWHEACELIPAFLGAGAWMCYMVDGFDQEGSNLRK
jgi:hypothetical protein